MIEGEYKLVKTHSSNHFEEKTVQAGDNKVLGFNSTLDPKAISLLKKTNNAPVEAERIYGTQWYCDTTDRVYTWMGAWVDLHNTFPVKVTIPPPAVGDLYHGGVVGFVNENVIIIVCTNPLDTGHIFYSNYMLLSDTQAWINEINDGSLIDTGYYDWFMPYADTQPLLTEFVVEKIINDGDEPDVTVHGLYWWVNPEDSNLEAYKWDGLSLSSALFTESDINSVYAIRIEQIN